MNGDRIEDSFYLTGTINDSLSMPGPEKCLKGTFPPWGCFHIFYNDPQALGISPIVFLTKTMCSTPPAPV